MPLHPRLEGPETRLQPGPRRCLDKRIARGDQALELGPLVSAAPRGLLPEGVTPAQDQPHRAMDHFMDVRGKRVLGSMGAENWLKAQQHIAQ